MIHITDAAAEAGFPAKDSAQLWSKGLNLGADIGLLHHAYKTGGIIVDTHNKSYENCDVKSMYLEHG